MLPADVIHRPALAFLDHEFASRLLGGYTYSSGGIGRPRRSRSAIGW
jgi:hypothetical protein